MSIEFAPPNIADIHSVVFLMILLYSNSDSLIFLLVWKKIRASRPVLFFHSILNAFNFAISKKKFELTLKKNWIFSWFSSPLFNAYAISKAWPTTLSPFSEIMDGQRVNLSLTFCALIVFGFPEFGKVPTSWLGIPFPLIQVVL